MKGILQYCSTESGTYKSVGTLRTRKDQGFNIKPITGENRQGDKEDVAYKVTVEATCLTLNSDFLDADQWYFRIIYPTELTMRKLGQRLYSKEKDGQLTRRVYERNIIKVEFTISRSDYDTYADTENLPESEGGIVIDDSPVYVE